MNTGSSSDEVATRVAEPVPEPFDGPGQVRREHDRLLEGMDGLIGDDPGRGAETTATLQLEASIRAFVLRASATGVYLDDTRDRTATQVLVDYWSAALSRAGARPMPSRLAPFDGERLPVLPESACPYVGLEAFTSGANFFGREPDTKDLLDRVRALPLIVMTGPSGSGKSSLVMGGLLPAIEAGAGGALRAIKPFAPGREPLRALLAATASGERSPDVGALRREPARLATLLGGAQASATLVTVDQFEEVFTLATAEDRDAFVAALVSLLQVDRGHRVLLTVREEFRSRIVELSGLTPYLGKAWYAMRPLTYDELRAAVERPAAAVNLQFQAGIVDDLIKKVLGQPAALPLLQFTLRALWTRRRRNRITRESYEAVGDPLQALEASAERFYVALLPELRDEVQRILLELVRVDELLEAYRQPVPRSRLEVGRANTEVALAKLEQADFVRVSSSGGEPVVELKHEALVRNWPRLVDWIDGKRKARRRRLAVSDASRRWWREGKPSAGLLTGWQLEEAKGLEDLPEAEKEFVAESAAAAKARAEAELGRKRRVIVVLSAAVAVLVAAVVAIGAALLYVNAKRVELRAEAARQQRSLLELQLRSTELMRGYEELSEKQRKLEGEKQDLERKYNGLVAQFSANVAQAVAPAAERGRGPVTIYLHISSEEQRPRAQEIANQLQEQGVRVPGIQRVDPVPSSDVRYFHPEDRAKAEELAKLLSRYVGGGAPLKPLLVKGFEAKVKAAVFELWFGEGALGTAPVDRAAASRQAPGAYLVVLGNDSDCPGAADSFLRARAGLHRALGAVFDPERLRLLSGTAQGQPFLVTAYGGDLTAEDASTLLGQLRGRPDLPSDAYLARSQLYQAQRTCSVGREARRKLEELAQQYRALRGSAPAGAERTAQMGQLFERLRLAAGVAALDVRAIEALQRSTANPDGARVAALAAVASAPRSDQLPIVLASVRDPLSAFEQYQAIRLVDQLVPSLSPPQRAEAQRALEEAWSADLAHLRTDASRAQPVQRLLRTLADDVGARPR